MKYDTRQELVQHGKMELKSLQILRAIAATSVVYLHIVADKVSVPIPVFGSFGVDIFFVINQLTQHFTI